MLVFMRQSRRAEAYAFPRGSAIQSVGSAIALTAPFDRSAEPLAIPFGCRFERLADEPSREARSAPSVCWAALATLQLFLED